MRVWRLSVMNMFYYKWLRFPQYIVVYDKQLKLTVPTVHCFSVSHHVQCIWLAQLLLITILYLCLKMSESAKNLCERGEWNEQWKWYQCPLRFIIVVVFILRRSLMNSGPLFSALIAARYVCLVITCWALLT